MKKILIGYLGDIWYDEFRFTNKKPYKVFQSVDLILYKTVQWKNSDKKVRITIEEIK